MVKATSVFAGIYNIGNGKLLVSAAGSVGAKLKLAFVLNRHNSIGIDCVAMCINNVISFGATPLFFQHYIATGKVYPDKISQIMSGLSDGCVDSACAMLGGEISELTGMYKPDEYELAGFALGIVDEDKIIDSSKVAAGDVLVGLASNGVHANGFSMIRQLFSIDAVALSHYVDALGTNLGEELLKPSRIYASSILSLVKRFEIIGIAHVTRGGLSGSIPRMLPPKLGVRLGINSWPILPVYELIRAANKTPMSELFNVFNMGIGMVMIVPKNSADAVVRCARELGENAYIIGDVVAEEGVQILE